MLLKPITQISNVGTNPDFSIKENGRIKLVNYISISGILAVLLSLIATYYFEPSYDKLKFHVIYSFLFTVVYIINVFKYRYLAQGFLVVIMTDAILYGNIIYGPSLYLIYMTAIPLIVLLIFFGDARKKILIPMLIIFFAIITAYSIYQFYLSSEMEFFDFEIYSYQVYSTVVFFFVFILLIGYNYKLLQKVENELKDLNHTLEDRVAERTIELEEAKNKLAYLLDKEKEIGEVKSRFISMISHEYRTPLSIILTSTELLEMYIKKGTAEKSDKQFKRIKIAIDTLTNLVEDVITFSKSDEESSNIIKSKFNLESFITDFIQQMHMIDNNQHKIELSYETDIELVITDQRFLRQILTQIIFNAMKYSPEGSLIQMYVHSEKDALLISISDSGPGISEEDQKNLFTPFYKNDEQIGIKSGTGLGLSIAKKYVDSLGGFITCSSKPGFGSTFTIKLPLK